MKKLILMMSFIFLGLNGFSEDKKDDCYHIQQKQADLLANERADLLSELSEARKKALSYFDLMIYETNHFLALNLFQFCKAYKLNKWYTENLRDLVLDVPEDEKDPRYETELFNKAHKIKLKIDEIKRQKNLKDEPGFSDYMKEKWKDFKDFLGKKLKKREKSEKRIL